MKPIRQCFERAGLWVFLCSFALCSLVAGGHLYSPDEEVLFRTAESFARFQGGAIAPLGGSQQVVNRRGQVVTVYEPGFASRRGLGGREYAQYGIGQPLLAVPLVWLGKLYARLAPEGMLETLQIRGIQYHERTVRSYAERLAMSHFNPLVTAVTAWLLYAFAARLGSDRRVAAGTGLIYVSATMALPHSKTFFTEPLAALCVLGSFALAQRGVAQLAEGAGRRARNALVLSGFVFGWGILTRLDTVMMGPGIVLLLLLTLCQGRASFRPRALRCLLQWALPAVGCVLLIFVLNKVRYGGLLASGYSDQPEGVRFSTPLLRGLGGFLFSPGRSLFIFSPIVLLAPVGWWQLQRRNRSFAVAFGLSILLFLVLQSKWQNWSGGWDWGPRHIFQLTPLLTLPLAWLFAGVGMPHAPWKRIALVVLLIAGVVVNLLGMSASPMDAYATLPAQLRGLTIWQPSYSPPSLHYNLITQGGWDLLLPRMLSGPSLFLRLVAAGMIALLLGSIGGLWRTWPVRRTHAEAIGQPGPLDEA